MELHFDLEESASFWDDLEGFDGNSTIIGELVSTVVGWALRHPYRAPDLTGGVRVLKSAPVWHDGITYSFRVAYSVIEFVTPRKDGTAGVVRLEAVEWCDEDEMLDGDYVQGARDLDQ